MNLRYHFIRGKILSAFQELYESDSAELRTEARETLNPGPRDNLRGVSYIYIYTHTHVLGKVDSARAGKKGREYLRALERGRETKRRGMKTGETVTVCFRCEI